MSPRTVTQPPDDPKMWRRLVGPNPALPCGTHFDAQLVAYTRVRRAYTESVAPLNALEQEAAAILRDALGPLAGGELGWGNALKGIRDQRAGDPEVRARSLERRGIRLEFSGAQREA